MTQGTTPTKKIKIGVDPALVESIIFTIKSGNHLFHKRYPEDVKYEGGYYLLNLTQNETVSLHDFCLLEAQINFSSGVVAKTTTEKFFVGNSIYTQILGNHAGGVDESTIQMMLSDDVITVPVKSESDHNELLNRDMDDQHPITAITGLQEKLDSIPEAISELELRRIIGNF